jgi:plastocyanin
MSRGRLMIVSAAVFAALVLPAARATAGGGECYADASQGTGVTVRLEKFCPTPSILRVDSGATVTFVNEDPIVHNVIGTGGQWGHPGDLGAGDAFTAKFTEPGVYPFACWYHPGMTGAVVVGDGTGAGNGQTVTVESATLASPSPIASAEADPPRVVDGGSVALGWAVAGGLGLALGAGGTAGIIRKRRATNR